MIQWLIKNKNYFALASCKETAETFRAQEPRLKHAHIKEVLQLQPDKAVMFKLYDRHTRELV